MQPMPHVTCLALRPRAFLSSLLSSAGHEGSPGAWPPHLFWGFVGNTMVDFPRITALSILAYESFQGLQPCSSPSLPLSLAGWLRVRTFQTAPLGFSKERAPHEPAKNVQRECRTHAVCVCNNESSCFCTIIEPCLDRLIMAAPAPA